MINIDEKEVMKGWLRQEKPVVSVKVTAYNHEKYIADALDSMLMQRTDFPFEIVVHEDASTDGTANIIRQYEEKYPNIAHAFQASGIADYLYVDGVAYGTPMPIFFNFAPKSYYLNMMAAYYRVDWAEELGFHWGAGVSLTEFEAYLKEMDGSPTIAGLRKEVEDGLDAACKSDVDLNELIRLLNGETKAPENGSAAP